MALMRARHKDLGAVVEVPDNDYYRDLGWEPVSSDTPTTVEAEREAEAAAFVAARSFNPAEHPVAEVVEHIQTADEVEAARVIEAEKTGKARKSVVNAAE